MNAPARPGATHLLLVDPDPLLQEMVETGLRLFNPSFVVLKAEGPEQALALLRRQKVEVVITELDFAEVGASAGSSCCSSSRSCCPSCR